MRSPALILLVLGLAAGEHLGAQGDAREVAERSRPSSVIVLLDEASPTDRALASAILELLPTDRVRGVLRGSEEWAPSVLSDLDGPSAPLLLAVGAAPAAAVLRETRRAPLLLCGRLDERVVLPPPDADGGRRVVAMGLPGVERALPAALARYLPGVRRVGLITRRQPWPMPAEAGRGVTIIGIHAGERSAPDLISELGPRVEALLILDEPGILASGETLMREAQRAGIPVITDAPWLARSGAALGVLPRLELWAVRIAARLRDLGDGTASLPGTAPPPVHEIDVGVLGRLGMLPEPARLAAAQVLRGTLEEHGR